VMGTRSSGRSTSSKIGHLVPYLKIPCPPSPPPTNRPTMSPACVTQPLGRSPGPTYIRSQGRNNIVSLIRSIRSQAERPGGEQFYWVDTWIRNSTVPMFILISHLTYFLLCVSEWKIWGAV